MIKIHKDLTTIPKSLVKGSTLSKRQGVIAKGFPKVSSSSSDKEKKELKEYEKRFKSSDIKKSLKELYKNKCAFCEEQVRACINNELEDCSSTVEHYRPKSIYYWLAYSWDNLLWCCYRCNQNKDNSFDVTKQLGTFDKKTFLNKDKNRIHNTFKIYHRIEKPFMIHPELESVLNKLTFVNGIIDSTDSRVKYTINTCKLDRADLNEKRLKILEDFIMKARKRNRLNKSYEDILDNLKKDFKDDKSEFRALKYWILMNHISLVEEN